MCIGGVGGGVGEEGLVEPAFDAKFAKLYFHGKFCKKLINLEYCIFSKYSQSCSLLNTSLQQVHFTTCESV